VKKKYCWEDIVVSAVLVVMLTVAFSNVLSRYIFHLSLSFLEELICTLFVLLSTIGGATAAKAESHYTLDLLTSSLKPKNRTRLQIVDNILSAAAALILTVTGIQMVMQQYSIGNITTDLRVPQWIYGAFVPLGCACMLFRFTQVVVRKIKELRGQEK